MSRTWTCRSGYVATRDGTRLATYVFRPVGQRDPAPAVWAHDRYHQVSPRPGRDDFLAVVRAELADVDLTDIDDLGVAEVAPGEVTLRAFPIAQRLLARGYVVVVVDSRGSGASFGTSDGPFGTAEATDTYDITEWIAAQPWCDGRVGMFGRSYLGVSQYLAASTAPPHLVAIFPQMALFDLHRFAWDGGVFRDDFARAWGEDVRELDLRGPVAPLDDDPDGLLLAAAREQHVANRDVRTMFAGLPAAESRLADTGEAAYLTRSPSALLTAINASGVAVYHLGGWHDVWARDATEWARRLTVPHRVVIGPWPHTGGVLGGAGYNLADEHVRWFDHWLRGRDTGIMDGPAVRYHLMGADEWRTARSWPPEPAPTGTWHLGPAGELGPEPRVGADRRYEVDYATTSGKTSRWASGYGSPFQRPDMTDNDTRALCWTSPPLTEAVELVGAPVLRLAARVSAGPTDVFAYLESVAPDGTSRYVTEGCGQADGDARLAVELHPIAYRFAAGDRIRLAVTGADTDNALTVVRDVAPVLTVRHDAGAAPTLELPRAVPAELRDGDEWVTAPLSVAQRAIWLAEQAGTSGAAYHLAAAVELTGPVDTAALRAAVDEIVRRHEALRTTIVEVDEAPVQRIHPAAPLQIERLDLTDVSGDGWASDERVTGLRDRRWDLGREWPIRVATVRLPAGRTALLLVVHHVAADPTAAEIFFAELALLYPSYAQGQPVRLPDVPCQYAEVARRQQAELAGPGAADQLARWRRYLDGAPQVITLPTDRPRPPMLDNRGGSVRFAIDEDLAARLVAAAAAARTSPFTLLTAAFARTLNAYGAGDDLLIGTPSLQRDDESTRDLIGCLVNLLPLRIRIDSDATVAQFLHDVRGAVLTALELRRVPFDTLVGELRPRRDPAVSALVQVLVRFGRAVPEKFRLGEVEALRLEPPEWTLAKYDLMLAVDQVGEDRMVGSLDFRLALFDRATVGRIRDSLLTVLDQLVSDQERPVGELSAMPRRELRAVLDGWNPARLPDALVGQDDLPQVARCYVLDEHRRPVPVNTPGRLWVGGTGDVDDPYAGTPGARMRDTGAIVRWSTAGRLELVPPATAPGTPAAPPDSATAAAPAQPATAAGPTTDDGRAELLDQLGQIWAALLKVDDVAPGDDFFDLGGDSLFAIRLIGRIRKACQVRLSLQDVFAAPTLGEQVDLVRERQAS
ncbi:CocE/NonD family hydrolase [Micromonospora sp. C31]|uniref:CocE/NonD family hydrolase n=1 Tax=Micromonospora sp. C31 TaxID=2824876 RepID=UPI001B37E3CC|nr:CocE/NonD family hydrolase [Micromonospora sp. C31]MBQ1075762.1 CocE/NonD family hydrolase [Micromonospora sp. C31]